MATPLVEQNDVEGALLRPLTSNEAAYLPTLVNQATARLRSRLITLDDRMAGADEVPPAPNSIDPQLVRAVLAEVIARKLNNPRGTVSITDTEGPFSHSESYAYRGKTTTDAATPGQIEITDADIATLNTGSSSPSYGTIRLQPGFRR